jgi:hypothetical protein
VNDCSVIAHERPRFGEVARQLAGLRGEQLESCLTRQRQLGGRLGDLLRGEGLLTREQTAQILKHQARWEANALQAEVAPKAFPYSAFLSVCLPAYNEQANILDTVDAACAVLPEFVQDFEVVVVDDGSHDETGDIVARYGEHEPRVRLVRHEHNGGYGAAVTTGLRAARGEMIMFMDSDGQFSLLDLPRLLSRVDRCDAVIGYRQQRADSCHRLLMGWGWTQLVGLVLGVRVRDLDCAFKLFRQETVERLRLTATGAAINAEIMVQCVRSGLRIEQTPVHHYPRYHGAPTGAALRVITKAFWDLGRMLKYRFSADPGLKGQTDVPGLPAAAPTTAPAVSSGTAGPSSD